LQFIRISEFNTMISQLIREQQVPYVYEKLGNRLHHFLLDEFQDTSRMQWLNLVPLIEESLSKQKQNLIVGDPKQSIYRFNNGVAEQFVALPGIYNPEQNPEMERKSLFFKEQGELQELVNNYRSGFEIVGFNNRFFQDLKTKIPERGVL
jgi:ATP-dependent exoDNAse (exonuclease V) beta subunit